ncbi:hypothetical protein MYP_3149 [Sporocytophaga myxococcoides]|uniref:Nitrogen fixation protein FixH n=1 Tax=Sporocytophaga myxococcoides TaxID=153721 RepID=A0A098LG23_9BACT|nr:FixH family protein [Sporocytophaga myxococcoides]GAL85920.1 hypothetical protein MYP_3149 [Sporocytophaga myxococcoides]
MSWGYRITILTLGFVSFMTFLVISAFRQEFDLVTEDYYGKELQFQNQIEKQSNQMQLKDSLSCIVSDNNVIIKFPDELIQNNITGEVLFFRPSDAGKDVKRLINSKNGVEVFRKELFQKGYYKVQVDYSSGGKKYYYEKSIIIS